MAETSSLSNTVAGAASLAAEGRKIAEANPSLHTSPEQLENELRRMQGLLRDCHKSYSELEERLKKIQGLPAPGNYPAPDPGKNFTN